MASEDPKDNKANDLNRLGQDKSDGRRAINNLIPVTIYALFTSFPIIVH